MKNLVLAILASSTLTACVVEHPHTDGHYQRAERPVDRSVPLDCRPDEYGYFDDDCEFYYDDYGIKHYR